MSKCERCLKESPAGIHTCTPPSEFWANLEQENAKLREELEHQIRFWRTGAETAIAQVDTLSGELVAQRQRAEELQSKLEAAEARNREAVKQEPVAWMQSNHLTLFE